MLSLGRSRALRPVLGMGTPFMNQRLFASGIEKNMEGGDEPLLEMGDIRASDGNRAIGRASLPLQTPDTVMPDSRPSRAKDEVRRQVGKQRSHGFGDRGMAFDRGIRLVQHTVCGIEFTDRLDAPHRVALPEVPKVRLTQAALVDVCL